MNIDSLIDRFVEKLNSSACDEDGIDDAADGRRGVIRRADSMDWISSVEDSLPARFPRSYGSLVARYVFPPFDCGPVRFWGNTLECGGMDELRTRLSSDPYLTKAIHQARLIYIGGASSGSYDPICFDCNKPQGNREFPMVTLDHEHALQFGEAVVVEQVAPSFHRFVESYLNEASAHV